MKTTLCANITQNLVTLMKFPRKLNTVTSTTTTIILGESLNIVDADQLYKI